MDDRPKVVSQKLEAQLDNLAEEFAWLLAKSDLDQETQEALLGALPNMELEQIIELVSTLEAKYTIDQTADLDNDLDAKLDQITSDFSVRQKDRDDELIKKLETLANNLD